MSFRVAEANEYLVITGANISDVKIAKKAWVWPGQVCRKFTITPVNYTLSLHAMTAEKLEFELPAVFTIGPLDEPQALMKYARALTGKKKEEGIHELVRGVVEGETRVIAASMTMEEIFKERKFFKEHVMTGVQSELEQFGMKMWRVLTKTLSSFNANVKQLADTQGSEYFRYLRLKSHEGAINQAKVDVAEAKMRGTVGEKEREAQQRKDTSRIEADAILFENQRKVEIAGAQSRLKTEQTKYDNDVQIARIEAEKKQAMRNAELDREVEIRRALVMQERQRAESLSKAKVEAETITTLADARFYKAKVEADAMLYAEQQAALAVKAKLAAQAEGISLISHAFGGDVQATLQYLMLERGTFQQLAAANAEAIKGLSPKITVWNTGADAGADAVKPIRDIFQSLPPLLSTITDQTGISAPAWLAQMPGAGSSSGTAAPAKAAAPAGAAGGLVR
ncbi:hypothetical protein HK105_207536 [Polyrhizophydium stewartii]|uniref:Band 7 domain-containing protein n=1 Tax=Polyrhizophydium stewartii TaxID=2732419 RepID=A0ABR4N0E6_9FUNG